MVSVICAETGCRHVPEERWSGKSSYRIVRPPTPERRPTTSAEIEESRVRYRTEEAQAILPLKLPEYPAAALAAKAGAAIVGVRVVIGTDGRVLSVEPSAAVFSTPGPYAADFLAAVQVAVRQWRFRPAELQELHLAGEGSQSYWRAAKIEPTEAEFTIEFTFTASGQVQGPGA